MRGRAKVGWLQNGYREPLFEFGYIPFYLSLFQQSVVAFKRLIHPKEAEQFYGELKERNIAVRVGMEASGHARSSDGGDNHSRYTEGEIKSQVKEADVMIYAIGIYDRYFPTQEERLGPELLSEISEVTGGRSFTIDNPNDLPGVASKIGTELRNQYVLGYRPRQAGA